MILIKKNTGTYYGTNKKYLNHYYSTNSIAFGNTYHGLYLNASFGYYYHGGRRGFWLRDMISWL